ncbi:hypothetical protein [Halalkalibacter alkalisediminis]|uniref:Transposase n=1 Tax=Halalkalibacter alkalisediminis TaxID=935616 RepID=A0ABV6NFV8_9BACI|nr:hypothetical protein [Halalkalibacter alkalisediminis]
MNSIKGYSSLPEVLKELFNRTYKLHMGAMSTASREKYTIDQIKHVKWDNTIRCLKVFFKNGDWWHYNTSGEWY